MHVRVLLDSHKNWGSRRRQRPVWCSLWASSRGCRWKRRWLRSRLKARSDPRCRLELRDAALSREISLNSLWHLRFKKKHSYEHITTTTDTENHSATFVFWDIYSLNTRLQCTPPSHMQSSNLQMTVVYNYKSACRVQGLTVWCKKYNLQKERCTPSPAVKDLSWTVNTTMLVKKKNNPKQNRKVVMFSENHSCCFLFLHYREYPDTWHPAGVLEHLCSRQKKLCRE